MESYRDGVAKATLLPHPIILFRRTAARAAVLAAAVAAAAGMGWAQQGAAGGSWIARYQARVTATQNAQPHWITPLVTVTPRLEQELRADFVHQYAPNGAALWTYGNGKGLELIPAWHTEILLNAPPFLNHSNGAEDGFGDVSFMAKERLYARNEEHGNGIVTVFLAGSIPTGKNGNGSCCAVVTPTLAMGKGFGQWALTTTAGGTLPVTNSAGLGHSILWNSVAQYHGTRRGLGRSFWPEVELNSTFFKGGAHDGSTMTFATPGVVIGRVPLRHDAEGRPGRLGLTFGAGEQIALTHFHTYNHATVVTVRMPF